jgi:MoaA/NifB/PqqE/SkfB family radical SAM enzyme
MRGPPCRQRSALPADLLIAALEDARAKGYTAISVSGGEPLLYGGLISVLRAARDLGLATALTTNGIPLTPRRIAALKDCVDLIAISVDGVPSSHDEMRGQAGAFAAMQARLSGLRASRIPFGFIFTLTDTNIDELTWVAGFAIEEGARLLQIHPLEEVGRAVAMLRGRRPGELAANIAYVAYMGLQDRVGRQLLVQLDFAHRDLVREEPWRVYAENDCVAADDRPLAELVDTLVVEADGVVVPLQHGFPRQHALGSLLDGRLSELGRRWRLCGYAGFRERCRRTFERCVSDPTALPAFNWFEEVGADGTVST